MIKKDAYNNSAWNHLYFVLSSISKQKEEKDKNQLLNKYVNFTLENIIQFKGNRASWNFLRGLFPSIKLKNFSNKNKIKPTLLSSFDEFPQIY